MAGSTQLCAPSLPAKALSGRRPVLQVHGLPSVCPLIFPGVVLIPAPESENASDAARSSGISVSVGIDWKIPCHDYCGQNTCDTRYYHANLKKSN